MRASAALACLLATACTSASEREPEPLCPERDDLLASGYVFTAIPRRSFNPGIWFELAPDGTVGGHPYRHLQACSGALTADEAAALTDLWNEHHTFCAADHHECHHTDPVVYDFALEVTAGPDAGFTNDFAYANCGHEPIRDALVAEMWAVLERLLSAGFCEGEPYPY